jgi:ubiquitin thioesterase protein OTUB1
MQTHPASFEPFLLGQDIQSYCATSIEPHLSEIEHVGITALADALVRPAGFALEISYLDRSAGEEVNKYRLDPTDPDGLPLTDPLTIRLLYRP